MIAFSILRRATGHMNPQQFMTPCPRPVKSQSRANPSWEWGGRHEISEVTVELLIAAGRQKVNVL